MTTDDPTIADPRPLPERYREAFDLLLELLSDTRWEAMRLPTDEGFAGRLTFEQIRAIEKLSSDVYWLKSRLLDFSRDVRSHH